HRGHFPDFSQSSPPIERHSQPLTAFRQLSLKVLSHGRVSSSFALGVSSRVRVRWSNPNLSPHACHVKCSSADLEALAAQPAYVVREAYEADEGEQPEGDTC